MRIDSKYKIEKGISNEADTMSGWAIIWKDKLYVTTGKILAVLPLMQVAKNEHSKIFSLATVKEARKIAKIKKEDYLEFKFKNNKVSVDKITFDVPDKIVKEVTNRMNIISKIFATTKYRYSSYTVGFDVGLLSDLADVLGGSSKVTMVNIDRKTFLVKTNEYENDKAVGIIMAWNWWESIERERKEKKRIKFINTVKEKDIKEAVRKLIYPMYVKGLSDDKMFIYNSSIAVNGKIIGHIKLKNKKIKIYLDNKKEIEFKLENFSAEIRQEIFRGIVNRVDGGDLIVTGVDEKNHKKKIIYNDNMQYIYKLKIEDLINKKVVVKGKELIKIYNEFPDED